MRRQLGQVWAGSTPPTPLQAQGQPRDVLPRGLPPLPIYCASKRESLRDSMVE